MFKSDLSCRKTEIYFTSRNSVGKPAYPAAQVEVPSLTLSDSSCLFPHVPAFHRPVDSESKHTFKRLGSGHLHFCPRSDVSTLSLHLKGLFVIALCICALAPVQALLYNAAMLHICISAPLCAPQLLQLEWNFSAFTLNRKVWMTGLCRLLPPSSPPNSSHAALFFLLSFKDAHSGLASLPFHVIFAPSETQFLLISAGLILSSHSRLELKRCFLKEIFLLVN